MENNNSKSNEEIVKRYAQKINTEKKKSTKKTFIICGIVMIVTIIVCFLPIVIEKIQLDNKYKREESLKVTVPNVVGKTYNEAKKELSDLDLVVEKSYGSDDDENAIVTSQTTEGSILKKGDTVSITVLTKETIEKREQEQKKKNEESRARSKANTTFAEQVEKANSGSVKYSTSEYYDSTEKSGDVYKLKYTTSAGSYYYQLVSYNSDYSKVVKSTKLYYFSDYYGETQELEYAFKSTF